VQKLDYPVISRLYRFGTLEPLMKRIIHMSLILRDVVLQNASIYIPDSDCGVTRTVVWLLGWLGLQTRINLIPDGFITSKPLRMEKPELTLRRPVSADEVMRHLTAMRQSGEALSKRIAPEYLVSVKRPFNMPESAALMLAQTMLQDAANDLLHSGSRKHHSLHVVCHRTFSARLLNQLIGKFEEDRQSQGFDEEVRVVLINYPEISLDSVLHLYSLPSTVIWEVWDANPSAALHLYDPCRAVWLPPGSWIREITNSVDGTQALARAKGAIIRSTHQLQDRMLVKTWRMGSETDVTNSDTSQS
jgi:hypothetical protein